MNENIFNKAYEVAANLTHEWVDNQLNMGIVVSEQQIAMKFSKFYEKAVLNTRIGVLNF